MYKKQWVSYIGRNWVKCVFIMATDLIHHSLSFLSQLLYQAGAKKGSFFGSLIVICVVVGAIVISNVYPLH